MKSSATAGPSAGSGSHSNRRQPTRSVRTTTSRPANYYARPFSYRSMTSIADDEQPETAAPGFFPAITFFTDGIAALPKEVMRQFTLLKETEGKAYQPEQAIAELVETIKNMPSPPSKPNDPPLQPFVGFSLANSTTASANGSMIDGSIPRSARILPETAHELTQLQPNAELSETSQMVFQDLQSRLREMNVVLDEKYAILNSANETLTRQLARLDSALPYIDNELSLEAREGSNTHWALPHMKEQKRASGATTERSRRDVQAANNLAAAAAAVQETDVAASRSEARREAMLAKRNRNHVDSDFDDRSAPRKPNPSQKIRKVPEALAGSDAKASASASQPAQPPKRRRVEKPALPAADRSMAAAINGRTAGAALPEPVSSEGARKKPKPTTAQSVVRKRNNIASPSLASSPTRGTFATTTIHKELSPAPSMQRGNISRGRQNSAQSVVQDTVRNRPTSAASNSKMLNGTSNGISELGGDTNASSRAARDARSNLKDVSLASEQPEQESTASRGTISSSDVVSATAAPESNLKREETEPAEAEDRNQREEVAGPTSVPMAATRSRGGSRNSKPATPVNSTPVETPAPLMSRSRSTRGANGGQTTAASSPPAQVVASPRRSHKKGASALAAAANPRVQSRRSSVNSDEAEVEGQDTEMLEDGVDDMEDVDPDEPRYCICQGPSYGDMIGCDNDKCEREWFHLSCVGLARPPPPKTKWYCDDCKKLLNVKSWGRSR